MILLQLRWAFVQVGAFSFGGGYAALPLIQNQVVSLHHWISMAEFTDLITIAEMTPGPIAVNSATFVGIRIAGLPGAVIATFGCIFPSCIIVSLLAYIYYRYKNVSTLQSVLSSLRPTVVALIAAAGLSILRTVVFGENEMVLTHINWIGAMIFSIALFVLRKWKINTILVMSLCGVSRMMIHLIAGV